MDDKKFENYFKKQIEKFTLNEKEERDCVITIHANRDSDKVKECTDRLIKATLKTVLSVAKKYINKGASLQEMVNEGYFGILDAIKKYNPYYDPQAKFSTYAFSHIKNRILKVLNNKEKKEYEVSLDSLCEIPDFEEKFECVDYNTPEEGAIEKSNEEFLVSRLKELLTPTEFNLALKLIGFKYLADKQQTPKEIADDYAVTDQRIYQQLWEIRKKLFVGGLLNKKGKVIWR